MIVAIDPGTTESAVVVWDGTAVEKHFKTINSEVLRFLPQTNGVLCVEMVAHYGTGMPAGKEVFETCVWIGRFVQCWLGCYPSGDYRLIYRRQVKMHLCNSMRAKDSNTRQSIVDRFGGKDKAIGRKASPGPLYGISGDEWQALAVALTAEHMLGLTQPAPAANPAQQADSAPNPQVQASHAQQPS